MPREKSEAAESLTLRYILDLFLIKPKPVIAGLDDDTRKYNDKHRMELLFHMDRMKYEKVQCTAPFAGEDELEKAFISLQLSRVACQDFFRRTNHSSSIIKDIREKLLCEFDRFMRHLEEFFNQEQVEQQRTAIASLLKAELVGSPFIDRMNLSEIRNAHDYTLCASIAFVLAFFLPTSPDELSEAVCEKINAYYPEKIRDMQLVFLNDDIRRCYLSISPKLIEPPGRVLRKLRENNDGMSFRDAFRIAQSAADMPDQTLQLYQQVPSSSAASHTAAQPLDDLSQKLMPKYEREFQNMMDSIKADDNKKNIFALFYLISLLPEKKLESKLLRQDCHPAFIQSLNNACSLSVREGYDTYLIEKDSNGDYAVNRFIEAGLREFHWLSNSCGDFVAYVVNFPVMMSGLNWYFWLLLNMKTSADAKAAINGLISNIAFHADDRNTETAVKEAFHMRFSDCEDTGKQQGSM